MMNLRYFYFSAFLCIKDKRIYSKVAFCRLWAARVPHSSTAWSNHSFPACCWRDVDAGQNFWILISHLLFCRLLIFKSEQQQKLLIDIIFLQFDESVRGVGVLGWWKRPGLYIRCLYTLQCIVQFIL